MNLDAFFPYVLPEVVGCPDPTLRAAINAAAAEFCRESLAWTVFSDPITLIDGVADYDLDVPIGAYVHTVRDVWLGNRRLTPKTMIGMQDTMPQWVTNTASEPVYYNAAVDRGQIHVFPTPSNTAGALVLRMAYAPTLSATTLPDFLGQRYLDVVANGAKARLMLIPGQTWSNPELAVFYQTKFTDGIVSARIDEAHDRVRGSISIRPRMFGF